MNLQQLYNYFAEHPESSWIMEAPNAKMIYDFVKTHPIKRVLDLGTGIGVSAAVVALALKDKGETDYHIDSLEQFDKCVALARELIPKELQENMTIHKSDAIVWEHPSMPYQYFSIFKTIPKEDYDLIINDGPGPFFDYRLELGKGEVQHLVDIPNATVTKMLLENKIKPGTFVAWDGRFHMIKVLERYYGDNFYLIHPPNESDLSILEKIDCPLVFKDERCEMMIKSNYQEIPGQQITKETPKPKKKK
jgi:hypothetical protein